ncbi:OstA-like protein [Maribellus maritimus]|uniref:OstA-like protein n=1 Tax=Maribellus maritimus TaxID=2870838 RepID=UPI001EECD957|nr:OstA-like protein [Maribellus maritimus]MCG6188083.1 organic solvent tolerance protein OstA [Maribellus maritimus]
MRKSFRNCFNVSANFSIELKYTILKYKLIAFFLLLIFTANAQEKKEIQILNTEYGESVENNKNAQRLVGNVKIQHKDIFMWCDTAYTYSGTNRVDAFGHVHINQGDTLHLYARKIFYDGDISFAQAVDSVKFVNKTTTLYSDTLDYDLETNIGYYDDYGKIIDSTNVLTSLIGKYFVDEDIVHFYKDVEGYSDDYTLAGDTLYYNTVNGRITIVGPTTIRDSANTLYAEGGWYDTNTGEAELQKNPIVSNQKQMLKADYIEYNDENGDGKAKGTVQIEDFENQIIVTGLKADYNETIEIATVTDSAVFMMYSDNDTLFMHADTLRTIPDTIEGEKIVKAFYGVRFYRTDIQGICDSLVYYSRDSLVQMHNNPVIWSEIHQLSADMIEMQQKQDAPDELHLTNNSFIISKQDSNRFDQIKGKNMTGFVINKELNNIIVDGNGQTLYYAREKEEEIIGLNRAESSNIAIKFREGEIFKIIFLKQPEGQLKPTDQLSEEERRLSGFDWKINLRPLNRYDIFQREIPKNEEETKNLAEEESQSPN